MTEITRKPAFWIAFAVISVLSGAFAWRFFPQALPLIKLDVKMTRDDALDRASALAGKFFNRGRQALQPCGVGDGTILDRNVKVGAQQHALSRDIGVIQSFAHSDPK